MKAKFEVQIGVADLKFKTVRLEWEHLICVLIKRTSNLSELLSRAFGLVVAVIARWNKWKLIRGFAVSC